jgi:hypothetical protein
LFAPDQRGAAVFGFGRKQVRANNQVAPNKRTRLRYPLTFVPPVDVDLMREGFALYQSALADAGDPKPHTVDWEQGLVRVQAQLEVKYGRFGAEAVVARAALLTGLLRQDAFQQIHKAEGELPTCAMLKVAGLVPAIDGDEGIDLDAFAEMLAERGSTDP